MILTENLLDIQQYTEEDIIEWMKVKVNDYVYYYSEFGDGPVYVAKFLRLEMRNKIPCIVCRRKFGEDCWGYIKQYKIIRKRDVKKSELFW
jgi:hypothetical protein